MVYPLLTDRTQRNCHLYLCAPMPGHSNKGPMRTHLLSGMANIVYVITIAIYTASILQGIIEPLIRSSPTWFSSLQVQCICIHGVNAVWVGIHECISLLYLYQLLHPPLQDSCKVSSTSLCLLRNWQHHLRRENQHAPSASGKPLQSR